LVRLADDRWDPSPRQAFVEIYTDPTSWADVGRHEEMFGLVLDVVVLGTSRRVQQESDATVTVMVDRIGGERLAAHAEVREAVGNDFLGFGKRETDFPNGLVNALGHGSSVPQPLVVGTRTRVPARRSMSRECSMTGVALDD